MILDSRKPRQHHHVDASEFKGPVGIAARDQGEASVLMASPLVEVGGVVKQFSGDHLVPVGCYQARF